MTMTPCKLTVVALESERRRWKVVRLDTMADVPGLILLASEMTGMCLLRDAVGENHEHRFGANGLRIVSAGHAND